jgi:hypothetical protein
MPATGAVKETTQSEASRQLRLLLVSRLAYHHCCLCEGATGPMITALELNTTKKVDADG